MEYRFHNFHLAMRMAELSARMNEELTRSDFTSWMMEQFNRIHDRLDMMNSGFDQEFGGIHQRLTAVDKVTNDLSSKVGQVSEQVTGLSTVCLGSSCLELDCVERLRLSMDCCERNGIIVAEEWAQKLLQAIQLASDKDCNDQQSRFCQMNNHDREDVDPTSFIIVEREPFRDELPGKQQTEDEIQQLCADIATHLLSLVENNQTVSAVCIRKLLNPFRLRKRATESTVDQG